MAKASKSKKAILGQPSWRIVSAETEAFVTETGGHLGPVVFDRRGRKLKPFSVAPWAKEPADPSMPPVLRALRGDFFCMPFGGNATPYRGEHHPVHGETANAKWKLHSLESTRGECTLHLSLRTNIRRGRVDKTITLRDGHPALYVRHIISEMKGPMPLGHHAMLRFPDEPGSGVITTSRCVHGQVYPKQFEDPATGGYNSLKPGASFNSLAKVPMISGGVADLSRYPARRGFEDLVMLVSDPKKELAWTAVTFPKQRFVWFALKNPEVLASTILWISNGGRHYAPWSSRHVGVLGLEEVTSAFHDGLAESAKPNPISAKGHATVHALHPDKPLTVSYVMACCAVPKGFDAVEEIAPDGKGEFVTLLAKSGKTVKVTVNWRFVMGTASVKKPRRR